MDRYIIIHYGEIALKGGNRSFFENKLIANIKLALADLGEIWLKQVSGRIIVRIEEKYNLELVKAQLQKVFGIEYFAFAWNSTQDLKELEKDLLSLIKTKKFKTFRITSRRTNKEFPLDSQKLSGELGAMIVKEMKKKVDLENYDLNCYVDIVENRMPRRFASRSFR